MATFLRNVLKEIEITPPSTLVRVNETKKQSAKGECPFANAAIELNTLDMNQIECPFHAHRVMLNVSNDMELSTRYGSLQSTTENAYLLHDIGGGDRIRECCTRFYARAFEDVQLKPFFFEKDGATAHGQRLADWIIEKMGGEGTPWTDSGRFGMRQPSHFKAWNSVKRDRSVRGKHFNLKDTRTWMRLHFWAVRECGLHTHQVFWKWYVKFLRHFIAIYERRAIAYAVTDATWSADPANIATYHEQGNKMIDLE